MALLVSNRSLSHQQVVPTHHTLFVHREGDEAPDGDGSPARVASKARRARHGR
jgi:hypothetical protein